MRLALWKLDVELWGRWQSGMLSSPQYKQRCYGSFLELAHSWVRSQQKGIHCLVMCRTEGELQSVLSLFFFFKCIIYLIWTEAVRDTKSFMKILFLFCTVLCQVFVLGLFLVTNVNTTNEETWLTTKLSSSKVLMQYLFNLKTDQDFKTV